MAFRVQISPGWHINGPDLPDPFLIPSELTVEEEEGITVSGYYYPEASTRRFPYAETECPVYEGEVILGALIRVAEKTPPGPRVLKAQFLYQPCDEATCLAPQTIDLKISFRVVPPSVPVKKLHEDIFERIRLEKVISESWMGVYMEGVKVGYSHSLELQVPQGSQRKTRTMNESWIKVSRLGGNPVEIRTVQESLYAEDGTPEAMVVRTRMSETEMVIRADIQRDRVAFFTGENLTAEIPIKEKFYLDIPVDEIREDPGFRPGLNLKIPVLDPLSRDIQEASFEILDKEDVMILGRKMRLWHARVRMSSIVPVEMDEWMDEAGDVWKSVTKASFMTTTSLRMSREKALEPSTENFDIAFSSLIPSNRILENPRSVLRMKVRLSGIPLETIKNFPYDDGSQKLLDTGKDFAILETTSQSFPEEEAVSFPVTDTSYRRFVEATPFCQSDDPEILQTARRIIGQERNAWHAATKIASWVGREMRANYDVGFATASEVLKTKEGDCSEHTVLTVALCRAVGIPARAAVGVMYAEGIFAYHMWPEVYVGRWMNLDPKWPVMDPETGELLTDATHIKIGRSGLDEDIFNEMVRRVSDVIGKLRIEILDVGTERPSRSGKNSGSSQRSSLRVSYNR